MFDRSNDTSVRRPRRVEVITGPERRRDWPDAEKIAIVAKALEPGVNVSEIARRHDLNPQQLFGWRKRWRTEAGANGIIVRIILASRVLYAPSSGGNIASRSGQSSAPIDRNVSRSVWT